MRVFIRRNINYFNGGTAMDVTADVHPEISEWAAAAARIVGLDVAGIDLKVPDICRPLEEQRGAILEVNAGPGLGMHLNPSAPPRPVGDVIIEHLFDEGETGRIPLVAVARGRASTADCVADLLGVTHRTVALVSGDGDFIGGRKLRLPGSHAAHKVRHLLLNPVVDALVTQFDPDDVTEAGFGFDRCAAALFNAHGESGNAALAPTFVQRLLETLADGGAVVLQADSAEWLSFVDPERNPIVLFHPHELHPRLTEHRQRGGRTAFLRGGAAILCERSSVEWPIPLERLPLRKASFSAADPQDLLAALAAFWALHESSSAVLKDLLTIADQKLAS
jgi:cyanophycin synthetase